MCVRVCGAKVEGNRLLIELELKMESEVMKLARDFTLHSPRIGRRILNEKQLDLQST